MTATTRIGFVQQKGGVAKTTDTLNVAGALNELGERVLVVDADPQGYLTNRLGLREAYQAESPTLFDAFEEPTSAPTRDLIIELDEFDVLPSNIDMFRLEQTLIASGMKPRTRLRDYFKRLTADCEYDYVLVDAPPSLGPINDNVLLATGNILIPCEADDTSILALEHLLNQIETLEEKYDTRIRELGILVSNVNYPLDNEQTAMLEWYEDTFGGRSPVYVIRHRAAIKRAMNNRGSIFAEGAEECDMTDVFLQIAEGIREATREVA